MTTIIVFVYISQSLFHSLSFVDPDRLDFGVVRHRVDQCHKLAVRCELPGLNAILAPVRSVLLNMEIFEVRRTPALAG